MVPWFAIHHQINLNAHPWSDSRIKCSIGHVNPDTKIPPLINLISLLRCVVSRLNAWITRPLLSAFQPTFHDSEKGKSRQGVKKRTLGSVPNTRLPTVVCTRFRTPTAGQYEVIILRESSGWFVRREEQPIVFTQPREIF